MRPRLADCCAAVLALLLGQPAQAQTTGVYRCGNSYSEAPCPGGQAVVADDARSAAQREQAQAVKQQDAQLAQQLAAERRARDKAAAGQQATRIGPSAAELARADALAAKKQALADAKKKKAKKPRKRDQP